MRVSIAKSRPKATFGAVAVTEGEDEGARSASPARRTVTLVIDVTDNGCVVEGRGSRVEGRGLRRR